MISVGTDGRLGKIGYGIGIGIRQYVNGPDTLSRSFVEAVDMRCTGFECARKRGMSNNEDGDGHDADN